MKWGINPLFVILCLATSPINARTIKKKVSISHPEYHQPHNESSDNPPITIWIHGTRFIRRPIFNTFFKCVPSLKLAHDLASDYYLNKIAKCLNKTAPHIFPMETFYLFGWSGKLRNKIRLEAAQILYDEIKRIVAEYKIKYNANPTIRIIGHSHGGNVALYMGKLKDEPAPFRVKELILLACPVQEATKKYIEDDLFDRTYVLYSSLDLAQVIAPQVVYRVFRTKRGHLRSELKWNFLSGRRFDEHQKVAQIKIKINGRALFHTEFTHQKFVSLLPHVLHMINTWYIDYTHPPDTKKLLSVYTRKEQKFNERKARVRA